MNDMAVTPTQSIFSYELIDNKIPCGGFNLLGGGVKGRNIESKESQSLIVSLYTDTRTDQSVTPQRLLELNWEDYQRILPILQNPPSETKVVASNLRFTCLNYYDYLQRLNRISMAHSDEEIDFMFSKEAINGNIITLCDIANLYTKELGIKTVPCNNYPLDKTVNKILTQYYQLDNIVFDYWVPNATVWADPIHSSAYGISQIVLRNNEFKDFRLDFITEGNILTYVKPKVNRIK